MTGERSTPNEPDVSERAQAQQPPDAAGMAPRARSETSDTPTEPEILDACCGGRFWWWDKAHPLALYMDRRRDLEAPNGCNPNWTCDPDIVGDFRSMPFEDEKFRLVLFDPPHIVRPNPSGRIAKMYGALLPDTEQDDLRRGFLECWRVLAPGGTLVFKWAGSEDRVRPHFPAKPIVSTRVLRKNDGLGTRWFVFYKPVTAVELVWHYQEALAV